MSTLMKREATSPPRFRLAMGTAGPRIRRIVRPLAAGAGRSLGTSGQMPTMDVSETEAEFEVRVDLPGYKPEEVEVRLDHGVLTIAGERKEEVVEEEEGRKIHRIERRSGSFTAPVRLPEAIKEEQAEARFHDGLLEIRLPKVEESRPRTIGEITARRTKASADEPANGRHRLRRLASQGVLRAPSAGEAPSIRAGRRKRQPLTNWPVGRNKTVGENRLSRGDGRRPPRRPPFSARSG